MENIILINANNEGSFYGAIASQYAYKPRLRAIIDELYQVAKRSTNRAFVLEGEMLRAAQTSKESALPYMADDRVLVMVYVA